MKKHLVLAVAAFVAVALAAPALAAAATPTVYAKEVKGKPPVFVAPASVHQGENLTFLSKTDPKKVGPHTFTLVTRGSLPKTPKARKGCFAPKHICLAIAKWHEFNPKTEKIGLDLVDVGSEGWSTPGSTSKKGDSWFTEKKGASITKPVTADPATTPTLHFLCAVHPWMQAKTQVLPPVAPPVG